ncbi:gamma-glutamylcyclotransferase-like isoform X1 [Lytechinus variegatus]|uniref:gamma-glutamylcyclotransferase-like isoform X1 n=1 Tax=Lytechinus variegatus TaxID=7654 RepID=UPI001BB119B2|nr:gamma-glutamylcyclotransferase-like isoform X1 [Lytechinus variegatus]
MSVQKAPNDKFFYFCYASNLLKSRFHLYVPSAEFVSPAKLEGYRLNFRSYPGWTLETSQWRGSLCSIEEDQQAHVWGAIWSLDKSDVQGLYP